MNVKSKRTIIILSIISFIFIAYSIFLMYGLWVKDLNYNQKDTLLDQLAYRYNEELDGYEVVGFGKLESNNPRHLTDDEANVVIRNEIKGKPVVRIKQYAFQTTHIRTVHIPENVKAIEQLAFDGASLVSINFSEGLQIIEKYAFRNCHVEEIVFPNSLEEIHYAAFRNNTGVNKLHFENVLIKDYAFDGCYNLEEITFEGTVEIGAYAFNGTRISHLDLTGVTKIGDFAFSNQVIKSVYIPDSIELSQYSFYHVRNICLEGALGDAYINYFNQFNNLFTKMSKEQYKLRVEEDNWN